MKLTLPYPPPLNNLHTVVRGRKILTTKGHNYKRTAALLAMQSGVKPASGAIAVTLSAYRPRKAGDLDNLFKAPFDAVKGIAWGDDAQVREIHAYLDDDKHNPRVEIELGKPGAMAARIARLEAALAEAMPHVADAELRMELHDLLVSPSGAGGAGRAGGE